MECSIVLLPFLQIPTIENIYLIPAEGKFDILLSSEHYVNLGHVEGENGSNAISNRLTTNDCHVFVNYHIFLQKPAGIFHFVKARK